ncbi:MAG: DUF4912 domain-containing protein [Acidibacillus sp.]|nr:DUF4912 domain-containing protein [Acidibacillus sp.]
MIFSQVEIDNLEQKWKRKWQVHRLEVMVRDATSLFAYWEVGDVQKALLCDHFTRTWSEFSLFLRLHDVTDLLFDGYHANDTRTIVIHPEEDHYYFHHVQPNRHYTADVCTETEDGHLFTMMRSHVVCTPPVGPSQNHQHAMICFDRPHALSQEHSKLPHGKESNMGTSNCVTTPVSFETFDGYSLLQDKYSK